MVIFPYEAPWICIEWRKIFHGCKVW